MPLASVRPPGGRIPSSVDRVGATLMVAAGGGGDAISAAALGPALGLTDVRPVVMTYAWERLIIDPLPGPRAAADFTGLRSLAPDVLEILPTTRPIPPAGSTLPRLAEELPARLLLLDPTGGAASMTRQIDLAAEYFEADAVALVDVGGDTLTDGHDGGLRSPLADLLALACCALGKRPAQLLIPAPGIDGELPEAVVLARARQLNAEDAIVLDRESVKTVRDVVAWHPSEATGLLIAAAEGIRGVVEVRDAGDQVQLTDRTPIVLTLDAQRAARRAPASLLAGSGSLAGAQQVVANLTGICEIGYETRKAHRIRGLSSNAPSVTDLTRLDLLAAEAAERSADYISLRRLAELLGVRSAQDLAALRVVLECHRPAHYRPPLYRTWS